MISFQIIFEERKYIVTLLKGNCKKALWNVWSSTRRLRPLIWQLYCVSPVFINAKIIEPYSYWEMQLNNNCMLSKKIALSHPRINVFMHACIPGATPNPANYMSTLLFYLSLCGNHLKGPDEVLVWRPFFHWSNLFISSALSATVGDFYGYPHNIAAPPVIFSTVERCSHGKTGDTLHWNSSHLML